MVFCLISSFLAFKTFRRYFCLFDTQWTISGCGWELLYKCQIEFLKCCLIVCILCKELPQSFCLPISWFPNPFHLHSCTGIGSLCSTFFWWWTYIDVEGSKLDINAPSSTFTFRYCWFWYSIIDREGYELQSISMNIFRPIRNYWPKN